MSGADRARVWDLPTRIAHWSIALLVPVLWWTAEEGRLDLHIPAGLFMLALVVFRLIWGVVGSSTARFASFVKGPGAIAAYLRGRRPAPLGHNPLGALSVVAMLAVLVAQVGLGLFATDEDGLSPGPLAHLVSYETSEAATEVHENMFNILLVLIGLHIIAVLFYLLVRRRNLVGPMLNGAGRAETAEAPLRSASAWRSWAAAGAAALLALWLGGVV